MKVLFDEEYATGFLREIMSIRNLHILILVSVAYVAAQLVADISSLRDLTLFGFGVSAFSIAYPQQRA